MATRADKKSKRQKTKRYSAPRTPAAFSARQHPAGYVVERNSFLDQLGDQYSRTNTPATRRSRGITLTPPELVERMVDLSAARGIDVARIVDAGAGSGRFTIAAARAFPSAVVIAVENDRELARLLLRNLTMAGLGERVQVQVADFRDISLPRADGSTLFIGNPPYVRHHDIAPRWKRWYSSVLASRGIRGTQLAGLHAHFVLKSLELAREGDLICYVTSAEWLDTGYGAALRRLVLSYGRDVDIALADRTAPLFADALTTSVVATFRVLRGSSTLRFRHIGDANDLVQSEGGMLVKGAELSGNEGWTRFVQGNDMNSLERSARLGDLFSVHRGQVTGNNSIWIQGAYADALPPSVLFPAITRAKELISLDSERLTDDSKLKRVIDLPDDWSSMPSPDQNLVERFLAWAQRQGGRDSYIAKHRNPWFKVRLREPAPIVMTYMGRRPPRFVRNVCGARLINIAHGLYPRDPLSERQLNLVTTWLNKNVSRSDGRTYAGGLTKFEPKEAERLHLPPLDQMQAGT